MKRKIFSMFIALVLVLTLSLVTAVPVGAATTLTVDTSVPASGTNFHTIQAAIDAAFDGDTIIVAAGTYSGFTANVANLTILGAQADVDAAGSVDRGAPGDGDESVITKQVTIQAVNITLNGFKCVDSSSHGIYIEPGSMNAQILFNIISGPDWQGISNQGNSGVKITYNYVTGVTVQQPIESTSHSGTGIEITHNVISGCTGAKGINYWGGPGALINNNEINGTTHEAIYTQYQATISGNQIADIGGYGILLVGSAAGSTVSGNTISNTTNEGIQSDVQVTITDNDISDAYQGIQLSSAASGSMIDGNNIHDNQYWGLSIQPSVTTATVTNNQFTNNPYCGVVVWGDGEGSGININFNNITGNGIYGVESKRSDSSVDATNNWWGDKRGPSRALGNAKGHDKVKGDKVSPYVKFAHWLRAPV